MRVTEETRIEKLERLVSRYQSLTDKQRIHIAQLEWHIKQLTREKTEAHKRAHELERERDERE